MPIKITRSLYATTLAAIAATHARGSTDGGSAQSGAEHRDPTAPSPHSNPYFRAWNDLLSDLAPPEDASEASTGSERSMILGRTNTGASGASSEEDPLTILGVDNAEWTLFFDSLSHYQSTRKNVNAAITAANMAKFLAYLLTNEEFAARFSQADRLTTYIIQRALILIEANTNHNRNAVMATIGDSGEQLTKALNRLDGLLPKEDTDDNLEIEMRIDHMLEAINQPRFSGSPARDEIEQLSDVEKISALKDSLPDGFETAIEYLYEYDTKISMEPIQDDRTTMFGLHALHTYLKEQYTIELIEWKCDAKYSYTKILLESVINTSHNILEHMPKLSPEIRENVNTVLSCYLMQFFHLFQELSEPSQNMQSDDRNRRKYINLIECAVFCIEDKERCQPMLDHFKTEPEITRAYENFKVTVMTRLAAMNLSFTGGRLSEKTLTREDNSPYWMKHAAADQLQQIKAVFELCSKATISSEPGNHRQLIFIELPSIHGCKRKRLRFSLAALFDLAQPEDNDEMLRHFEQLQGYPRTNHQIHFDEIISLLWSYRDCGANKMVASLLQQTLNILTKKDSGTAIAQHYGDAALWSLLAEHASDSEVIKYIIKHGDSETKTWYHTTFATLLKKYYSSDHAFQRENSFSLGRMYTLINLCLPLPLDTAPVDSSPGSSTGDTTTELTPKLILGTMNLASGMLHESAKENLYRSLFKTALGSTQAVNEDNLADFLALLEHAIVGIATAKGAEGDMKNTIHEAMLLYLKTAEAIIQHKEKIKPTLEGEGEEPLIDSDPHKLKKLTAIQFLSFLIQFSKTHPGYVIPTDLQHLHRKVTDLILHKDASRGEYTISAAPAKTGKKKKKSKSNRTEVILGIKLPQGSTIETRFCNDDIQKSHCYLFNLFSLAIFLINGAFSQEKTKKKTTAVYHNLDSITFPWAGIDSGEIKFRQASQVLYNLNQNKINIRHKTITLLIESELPNLRTKAHISYKLNESPDSIHACKKRINSFTIKHLADLAAVNHEIETLSHRMAEVNYINTKDIQHRLIQYSLGLIEDLIAIALDSTLPELLDPAKTKDALTELLRGLDLSETTPFPHVKQLVSGASALATPSELRVTEFTEETLDELRGKLKDEIAHIRSLSTLRLFDKNYLNEREAQLESIGAFIDKNPIEQLEFLLQQGVDIPTGSVTQMQTLACRKINFPCTLSIVWNHEPGFDKTRLHQLIADAIKEKTEALATFVSDLLSTKFDPEVHSTPSGMHTDFIHLATPPQGISITPVINRELQCRFYKKLNEQKLKLRRKELTLTHWRASSSHAKRQRQRWRELSTLAKHQAACNEHLKIKRTFVQRDAFMQLNLHRLTKRDQRTRTANFLARTCLPSEVIDLLIEQALCQIYVYGSANRLSPVYNPNPSDIDLRVIVNDDKLVTLLSNITTPTYIPNGDRQFTFRSGATPGHKRKIDVDLTLSKRPLSDAIRECPFEYPCHFGDIASPTPKMAAAEKIIALMPGSGYFEQQCGPDQLRPNFKKLLFTLKYIARIDENWQIRPEIYDEISNLALSLIAKHPLNHDDKSFILKYISEEYGIALIKLLEKEFEKEFKQQRANLVLLGIKIVLNERHSPSPSSVATPCPPQSWLLPTPTRAPEPVDRDGTAPALGHYSPPPCR